MLKRNQFTVIMAFQTDFIILTSQSRYKKIKIDESNHRSVADKCRFIEPNSHTVRGLP